MVRDKKPALVVLNWGWGQDSTTIALMAKHGELPPFDVILSADTQQEPDEVYGTVEWVAALLDVPLYRVTAGDLGADILRVARETKEAMDTAVILGGISGDGLVSAATLSVRERERLIEKAIGLTAGHYGQAPFWVKNAPNKAYATADSGGQLWRKCTHDYKIVPMRRKLRELLGVKATGRLPQGLWVEQCIGFPLEEMGRTFCSDVQWIVNTFPLIDKRMRKHDCERWLLAHGYPSPIPKSSCRFCPYHSNAYWRRMRDMQPREWAKTVAFEEELHKGKLPGVRGIPYLHRSMVPLPMAPIDKPETGQEELFCFACHT